jgi:hypothetical protein
MLNHTVVPKDGFFVVAYEHPVRVGVLVAVRDCNTAGAAWAEARRLNRVSAETEHKLRARLSMEGVRMVPRGFYDDGVNQ